MGAIVAEITYQTNTICPCVCMVAHGGQRRSFQLGGEGLPLPHEHLRRQPGCNPLAKREIACDRTKQGILKGQAHQDGKAKPDWIHTLTWEWQVRLTLLGQFKHASVQIPRDCQGEGNADLAPGR